MYSGLAEGGKKKCALTINWSRGSTRETKCSTSKKNFPLTLTSLSTVHYVCKMYLMYQSIYSSMYQKDLREISIRSF